MKHIKIHINESMDRDIQELRSKEYSRMLGIERHYLREDHASDIYPNVTKNFLGSYHYYFKDKGDLKIKTTNCANLLTKMSAKIKNTDQENNVIANLDDLILVYNGIKGLTPISVDDNDRLTSSDLLVLSKAVKDISVIADVFAKEEDENAKRCSSIKDGDHTEVARVITATAQDIGTNRYKIDTFLDSLEALIIDVL